MLNEFALKLNAWYFKTNSKIAQVKSMQRKSKGDKMTAQQKLVKKVLANANLYTMTQMGPSKGITKPQLASLLKVKPQAVNNWLQGYNGISSENLAFLRKLERLIDAATKDTPVPHKVLGRPVVRKVVHHGISKFTNSKYMFLTTGQKHWTNANAVTV